MQLKNPGRISGAVAMAAGSLLGSHAVAGDGKWQLDTSLMYYGETDRVTAVEPVLNARRELGEDEFLNVKMVLDSLTGASHNGAPVRPRVQTFTSPSGHKTYDVPANTVPLDESFKDTRGNVALSWERPLANPLWRSTLGTNVSSEFDFFSFGVNGSLARDFNRRNTTVTGGLSVESDVISPVGGVPVPLAPVNIASPDSAKDGSEETRTVTDVLLGVTQVLGRNTIAQLNYSLSMSSGYHNDPYKVVADDSVTAAPGSFYYESRPDSRTKHALYGELKHALPNRDVVDASYRFMTDDWGIVSHTVDLHYRHFLRADWFVEPHVRWYAQGEADFWTEALPAAPAPGDFASGDYRLGALTDTTFGAKIGKRLGEDREISMRVESFQQSGDTEAADVSALILEFGYSFRW
ncbi:MAG: DUF3570 domain-containing protein [Pseudomonadota bacterium]